MSQSPEFQIEDNVPVPDVKSSSSKYPFLKMEVGQSFSFLPPEGKNVVTVAANLRTKACTVARKSGLKFLVRVVVEDGVDKIRCWRLK